MAGQQANKQFSSVVSVSVLWSPFMVDCDQDVQPNEPFPLQVGFGHDAYHRNGKQTDMYAYLVLYTHTTIRKETDIISNPYKPHKIFHKNPKSNTGSSAAGF